VPSINSITDLLLLFTPYKTHVSRRQRSHAGVCVCCLRLRSKLMCFNAITSLVLLLYSMYSDIIFYIFLMRHGRPTSGKVRVDRAESPSTSTAPSFDMSGPEGTDNTQ